MIFVMMFSLILKYFYLENGNLKGKDILILPLDLTDRSSHEGATKAVLQEFGKVSSNLYSYSIYCIALSIFEVSQRIFPSMVLSF